MRDYFLVQKARLLEVVAAEIEPHHRMARRPVPAIVDVEPLEERLAALEELLQGIQEQAFAEAPRARQEVVRAFIEQPFDIGRLVHVVAVRLPHFAEGLHTDGQAAPGHGMHLSPPIFILLRPAADRVQGPAVPGVRRIHGMRSPDTCLVGHDGRVDA